MTCFRNTDCDYSSAYISLFTEDESLVGCGQVRICLNGMRLDVHQQFKTFTIGRGNDIVSLVRFGHKMVPDYASCRFVPP